jgi:AAA+ ATPase superfamily predicted ATPase
MSKIRDTFIAGPPVEGDLFFDRENILNDILNASGNNFALIGVRRIGKTSLMRKLAKEFEKNGDIPIIISLPDIRPFNETNFLKVYTLAIIEEYSKFSGDKLYFKKIKMFLEGKWSDLISFIKNVRVRYKDIVEVWFEYSQHKQNLNELMQKVMQLPNELAISTARKNKPRFIIMIDEFQKITKLGDEFLWSLREQMQKPNLVNYIISGSATGMMNNITGNEGSPFYGLFLIQNLKGLNKKGAKLLIKRLEKFKVSVTNEIIDDVISKTSCYPLYLQSFALSYYLYAKSMGITKIRQNDLDQIWQKTFNLLYLNFQELTSRLSDKSVTILTTMAVNGLHSPAEIARSINEKLTSMGTYLPRLINDGFIEKTGDGLYKLADPMFKEWLRLQYSEIH